MSTASMPVESRRVVLVDLSSLYHPAWRVNENGPLSVAFNATLDAVTKCAKRDPNALVAICVDSRKSWRKELAPTYKAQREKLGNDFYGTLSQVKDRLVADGYLLWEAEGFEADDVIATACEEAVRRGHSVAICSADKDLMQLLRPGVKQLRTHDWSLWTEKEAEEKFGVKVSQIGDYLALVGDVSDNVKGCAGVGDKRASAMLQVNHDWAGIVAALAAKSFTPAITAALQGFDYETARKLVGLRKDVPINFDDIYKERAVKPLIAVEDPHVEEETPQSVAAEKAAMKPAAAPEVESDTIAIQGIIEMPRPANEAKTLSTAPANPTLQPNSVTDAWWLAKEMFNSRLYTKFGNPQAILAVMIRGKEMGFPVLTSLDLFHVISGKPSLAANTIQALAEKNPDCEYLKCQYTGADFSEWITKNRRHKDETVLRYTIEDAVAAGIATIEPASPPGPGKKDERGQWDKRRKEMLRKTAMVQLVRMVYPSATLGLYAREELTDREEE